LWDVLQFIGAANANAPPAPLSSIVSESSKIANNRPIELARMYAFYLRHIRHSTTRRMKSR
jgi:hypothetical protein